jgi:hypothetical protein
MVDEINEIVMKNYLRQQKITYHKISDSKLSFTSNTLLFLCSDGQGDQDGIGGAKTCEGKDIGRRGFPH